MGLIHRNFNNIAQNVEHDGMAKISSLPEISVQLGLQGLETQLKTKNSSLNYFFRA